MNGFQHPPPPQPGFVRVPPLRALPEILREEGIDVAPLLHSCGIADEGIFLDSQALLPFAVVGNLLKTCAKLTGLPHFGLLVGQRADAESLGAVGLLLRHSPDVMTAMNELVANLDIHQHGSTPFLLVTDQQAQLGYEVYISGIDGVEHIYDCAMAIGWNILRTLCGPKWLPIEVRLRHGQPADIRPYRQFFQAPMRFNSAQSSLVFATHWLTRSLTLANPALREELRTKIAAVRSGSNHNFLEQAQKVLVILLGQQHCTRDELAGHLDLHPRTLNRRLKNAGTSFRELHAAACHEMARQLLRDTRRSVPTIAMMLGYSDASAFSRSFRRWEGVPPAAWRKLAGVS